jgi:hypothetical protein
MEGSDGTRVDSVSVIGTGVDIERTRAALIREAFKLTERYSGTWELVREEVVRVNDSIAQGNVVVGRKGGDYQPVSRG